MLTRAKAKKKRVSNKSNKGVDWELVNLENALTITTNGWNSHSSKYCDDTLIPKENERFKEVQAVPEEDGKTRIVQSVHPWCLSCYGLYSQICESVAKAFNIPTSSKKIDRWKNSDLENMIFKILTDLETERSIVKMKTLQPLLTVICDCIKMRWYHHGKCYFNNDRSNPSLVKADISHMKQITFLCSMVLNLHRTYLGAIDYYKTLNKTLSIDFVDFSIDEEKVFNLCKHQISTYTSTDQNDLKCVFKTKTPKGIKKGLHSPDRDKELIKSGYEISALEIDRIRNTAIL